MKINWKVRFKNPQFWINLCGSLLGILLAYFGIRWEEITSWNAFFSLCSNAVQNPVVAFSLLACIWNALIDPTTKGLSDSAQALNYEQPADSGVAR